MLRLIFSARMIRMIQVDLAHVCLRPTTTRCFASGNSVEDLCKDQASVVTSVTLSDRLHVPTFRMCWMLVRPPLPWLPGSAKRKPSLLDRLRLGEKIANTENGETKTMRALPPQQLPKLQTPSPKQGLDPELDLAREYANKNSKAKHPQPHRVMRADSQLSRWSGAPRSSGLPGIVCPARPAGFGLLSA